LEDATLLPSIEIVNFFLRLLLEVQNKINKEVKKLKMVLLFSFMTSNGVLFFVAIKGVYLY